MENKQIVSRLDMKRETEPSIQFDITDLIEYLAQMLFEFYQNDTCL